MNMTVENTTPEIPRAVQESVQRCSRSLEIDVERYQGLLDRADLSDEEKTEFLTALWSIIMAFIDLGYGVHPAQQALGVSGSDQEIARTIAALLHDAA